MKWKTNILDLKAYQPGRSTEAVKKEYGLDYITKLASNENPYGYSLKDGKLEINEDEAEAIRVIFDILN